MDPTNVTGRRVAAYALDAFVMTVLLYLGFQLFTSGTTYEGMNVCESAPIDTGDGQEAAIDLGLDRICMYSESSGNNDSVVLEFNAAALLALPMAYAIGAVWILQGITGASPGKFAAGIRVVDEQGAICGVGRSCARSAMWVVDAAPGWCFCFFAPLVGFIAMMATRHHRRLGDRVAGTFVVGVADVGRPPTGAWAGGPASAPPGTSPWSTSDPTTPPPGAPDGQGTPQWDAARRAWIQYSPAQSSWLQHDPVLGTWRPIG